MRRSNGKKEQQKEFSERGQTARLRRGVKGDKFKIYVIGGESRFGNRGGSLGGWVT